MESLVTKIRKKWKLEEDIGSRSVFKDNEKIVVVNKSGDLKIKFSTENKENKKQEYEISICKLDDYDVETLTKVKKVIPKNPYEISFGIIKEKNLDLTLQDNDDNKLTRVVIDTIIDVINKFINKYSPDCIKFSGDASEGSRKNKYDKFARSYLCKNFGFKLLMDKDESLIRKGKTMKEYYLYK